MLGTKELMLLNCGVGEDSWESLGLQRDQTKEITLKEISPEYSLEGLMQKLKLQYFSHLMGRTDSWKRPWGWERLKAGAGEDRGGDSWMLSSTQWTWVWASSGRWWRTGRPGMLQSTGLQREGHDLREWTTTTQVSMILNTLGFFTFKCELLFHILCLSNDSIFLDVTNLLIEINLLTI